MQENKDKKSDDSVIKFVNEIESELKTYRKTFEADWKQFDDAYYGKQHKTGENVKTVKNHVFKIIETEVPVLTDSMPGTLFTATTQEKQYAADVLEGAVKWVYSDQSLQLLLPNLMRNALKSAPGYLYAFYNPDAKNGDGAIEYKELAWDQVLLDGNARTVDQSEKNQFKQKLRRSALMRMWPEKAEEIKKLKSSSMKDSVDDGNFEERDVSGTDAVKGKPATYSAKDILEYKETWVMDYDLEPIPADETQEELKEERDEFLEKEAPDIKKWQDHNAHIEDHYKLRGELLAVIGAPADMPYDQIAQAAAAFIQSNPESAQDVQEGLLIIKMIDNHIEEHEELKKINPSGERPKFEDGWRVIKSVGSVLLYDGPNPENNGMLPIVPFYAYKDDTIYGFGEIKNILDAQRTLNDMDFRELENLRVNANSGWIGDHEAEVEANKLTNAPGIVVLKKRGTELRRLEPGTISPQLGQRKELDQLAMESISGVNEQTMNGALPGGNVAAITFDKVQTQAVGRIRLKDRMLQYYSMRRLAMLTASLIINHWTEETVLRFRTDDSQIQELVYDPIEMQDLQYNVEISPGSMTGISKDAINAVYFNLLNGGHIDVMDFLSVAELPKKEQLLARLNEKNQTNAQVQQLQVDAQNQQMQFAQEIERLKAENIKLKGAMDLGRKADIELLSGDEKKAFEQEAKKAVIDSLVSQNELGMISNVENGAMSANQNNEGMM